MSYFGGKNTYKKRDYTSNLKYEQEEPECLIIPGTKDGQSDTQDMVLVPCGEIDGCTLYVESRDPQLFEAFGLAQGRRSAE